MDKYEKLYRDLISTGTGEMFCYGDSMIPILYSGCKLTFIKQRDYKVGDIVFCIIDGYLIDAHIITKRMRSRHKTTEYQISDSHGNINGITDLIFGRVIKAEYEDGTPTKEFN
jgi:hypothetical protein